MAAGGQLAAEDAIFELGAERGLDFPQEGFELEELVERERLVGLPGAVIELGKPK